MKVKAEKKKKTGLYSLRLYFHYWLSCVHNSYDHSHIHSLILSWNISSSYIHCHKHCLVALLNACDSTNGESPHGFTIHLLDFREIKHRVFFFPRTTERVTWPDISRVCRLLAAVSTRGGHFSRLEGTRKRKYFQPIFTVYFSILIACFYSYASFIILLLHELLVKLKEFQIQAENT